MQIRIPEWHNLPSHNSKVTFFWVAETVMGNVSIHYRNTTKLWYVNADFIHYPPSDSLEHSHIDYGINMLNTMDRFYGSVEPESLKEMINSLHFNQLKKFLGDQDVTVIETINSNDSTL